MDLADKRFKKITDGLNLSGIGLEIGPSHSPILPKASGYKVEILDHANAASLREKYRAQGVGEEALKRIEEVDYIWSGQPLDQLTKKKEYYDYILASHVIEHTPDFISFLMQCEVMLKVGGCISLAVPDKRYTFDSLRHLTSTGEVIQAFFNKSVVPSSAAIFDHFSQAAFMNGKHTWGPSDSDPVTLIHTLDEAYKLAYKNHIESSYIDIHNWVFTPVSFKSIIDNLRDLELINLIIKNFENSDEYEFIVHLTKIV